MTAALLGMSTAQDQANTAAKQAKQKMQKWSQHVGTADTKTKIDMGAIGQPGVEINIAGKESSQFVLDGTGRLSVAENDNKQSISYVGYRADSNEYYMVNLDPNQTALGYISGNFTKPNTLKMTEPTTQIALEVVFEKNSANTTVRIPPTQAVFMDIESTVTSRNPVDVLGQLMAMPVKPVRVNRKADSLNLAENYARSHALLEKMAGDFTTQDGYKASSRMVAEGRYLLTYVTEPGEFLVFTSYNNAGRFFQQILLGPALPMPMYLQGPLEQNGSILLSDPFNPKGMSAVITFEPNGDYSTSTSMDGKVVEERTWRLKK